MITIQKDALKAVSRFTAKADVRYYLVGVYVEASATETRLVATDGHTLLVHRYKAENTHSWKGIIPLATVQAILKHKSAYEKKGHTLPVELSECSGTEARIDYAGQAFIFQPIDGTFPDYRRVIPETISGEPACYQGEYLQRVSDAAKDLGAMLHGTPTYSVGYNGTGPAVFGINDSCMAVVMPVRFEMLNSDNVRAYSWTREQLDAPVKLHAVA